MVPVQQEHRRRRLTSEKGLTDVGLMEWTMGDDPSHESSAPLRRRRKRRSQIPQSIFADENSFRPTAAVSTAAEGVASVPMSILPLPVPTGLPNNGAESPIDEANPSLPGSSSNTGDATVPTETSAILDFISAPPFPVSTTTATGTTTETTSESTAEPTDNIDASGDSGIDSEEDEGDTSNDDDGDSDLEDEMPTPFPLPPPEASGTSRLEPPPTQTMSNEPETSSTSVPNPNASAEASRKAEIQHHQNTEMALIIVGCVAGIVCMGIGLWFLLRYIRRRTDSETGSPASSRYRGSALLRRIPFFNRYTNGTWLSIEETEKISPMDEKDLLAYLPDQPLTVPPDIRVISATKDTYAPTSTVPSHAAFGYAASNPEPPYSPTASSLSSAYGNGTYIPPTPLHPPPRRLAEAAASEEMLQLPPPVVPRYRDTVYTQSSEASSVPRFRTVSMWVRHQAKRLARDSVPEQGYGMMIPDDEAPRRVVVAPEGVGYSQ